MKRYRFHLIGLVFFVALLVFLNEFRKGGTLGIGETLFAINDRERVTGIIISRDNERLMLERKDNEWVVNSEHGARDKAVELMLQTLERLRISSPVPIGINEDVINKLVNESSKIEVVEGRRVNTFYIYSEGINSPAYIMAHGSDKAFQVEILGFEGDVESLFVIDEGYWRQNILFNYRPDNIAEVVVSHKDESKESFILKQTGEGRYFLFTHPGEERIDRLKDSLAIRYLANYFYVPYERFANNDEIKLFDSLYSAEPDYLIRVTCNEGVVTEVCFHRIITGQDQDEGQIGYDYFRLHALINDRTEMVVVLYLSVDLLLRSTSYFY